MTASRQPRTWSDLPGAGSHPDSAIVVCEKESIVTLSAGHSDKPTVTICLRCITSIDWSATLSLPQCSMVADRGRSIIDFPFSTPWVRAICAGETRIGCIVAYPKPDYTNGISCPEVFLSRFIINDPYQGQGYGRRALEKLFRHLTAVGVTALYNSCRQGEGSPAGFYRKMGFRPTGKQVHGEIELVVRLDGSAPEST
jgi:diamine N-acetyltransferase